MKLTAAQASANSKQPAAKWRTVRRRLRTGTVMPVVRPSFALKRGDLILTMGSCFARNIEIHLARWGCRVPMLDFSLPAHEFGFKNPADTLTIYNTPSFRQEIEWAERVFARDKTVTDEDCASFLYEVDDGLFADLGMNRTFPATRARCVERRQAVFDIYATAFTADCIVMTPGVSEAFTNTRTGFVSNPTPMIRGKIFDTDAWEFSVIGYETACSDLRTVIDLVRKHNPEAKFIISTSPVPLHTTFSGEDIAIANARSKAILRAACEAVAEARHRVDYFPSFEAVTLSWWRVWQRDRRHVTDRFVGKVVANLAAHYLEDGVAESVRSDAFEFSLGERIARVLRPRA